MTHQIGFWLYLDYKMLEEQARKDSDPSAVGIKGFHQ